MQIEMNFHENNKIELTKRSDVAKAALDAVFKEFKISGVGSFQFQDGTFDSVIVSYGTPDINGIIGGIERVLDRMERGLGDE